METAGDRLCTKHRYVTVIPHLEHSWNSTRHFLGASRIPSGLVRLPTLMPALFSMLALRQMRHSPALLTGSSSPLRTCLHTHTFTLCKEPNGRKEKREGRTSKKKDTTRCVTKYR